MESLNWKKLLGIAYVLIMLYFLELGVYVFIRFKYPYVIQILPQLSIASMPATENSLFIFPAFGLLLYRRFKLRAWLMFPFTCFLFELSIALTQTFVAPHSAQNMISPTYDATGIWIAVCLAAYYFVKPKFNVNNWLSVALFLWYYQGTLALPYLIGIVPNVSAYFQLIQEIIFCAWLWLSCKPSQ